MTVILKPKKVEPVRFHELYYGHAFRIFDHEIDEVEDGICIKVNEEEYFEFEVSNIKRIGPNVLVVPTTLEVREV